MLTMQEYLEVAAAEHRDHEGVWRVGQTYFNVLYNLKPAIADKVRGTPVDPFHNDARLPAFFGWLTHELA